MYFIYEKQLGGAIYVDKDKDKSVYEFKYSNAYMVIFHDNFLEWNYCSNCVHSI